MAWCGPWILDPPCLVKWWGGGRGDLSPAHAGFRPTGQTQMEEERKSWTSTQKLRTCVSAAQNGVKEKLLGGGVQGYRTPLKGIPNSERPPQVQ